MEFTDQELYKKIKEGELPINWSADIMKTVWGDELSSRLNDNQSK